MISAGPAGLAPAAVTPRAAADAYQRTESGEASFGAVLQHVLGDAVAQGHAAEQQAQAAIAGTGNITEVVTALARAELTLQSATAIRDRVVQAYQQIMQMPI
jgi:flagellar hook-basal body complex protein FliE